MSALDLPVRISRPAKDYLIVDEDHGGYKAGYCFACGQSGWIEHLEKERSKHKPGCEVANKLFGRLAVKPKV